MGCLSMSLQMFSSWVSFELSIANVRLSYDEKKALFRGDGVLNRLGTNAKSFGCGDRDFKFKKLASPAPLFTMSTIVMC